MCAGDKVEEDVKVEEDAMAEARSAEAQVAIDLTSDQTGRSPPIKGHGRE
jgi:hypothetical protein